VVGYFYNGTVTDCTSMATVDKDGHKNVLYFGGIIGYMSQNSQSSRATATNCFSYGIVSIGERNSGTVTNVERVHKVQNIDGNVTLPDAVDVTDGFYYDGIGYYKPGVSVPLIVTPAPVGYDIEVKQESISSGTITTLTPDESGDYTFTVPNGSKTFTISATSHVSPLLGYTSSYTPDGTADKPYIINSTEGWNLMCDCLQDNTTWNRFSGKTVKLDDDIEVTRMAGSSQHDFTGTFDGNKKTLTVDYNTSEQYAAPFRNAENGCVIENLIVEGTIATSSQNAAGIIGNQFGTVTIRNCRVGVTIESSKEGDGTHGGIVAVKGNSNSAKLTIEGCVFDGKIVSTGSSATTLCGGFVGWKKDNGTLTIKNSLYAPQADDNAVSTGATFARNWTMPADANCYYTEVLGTAQGTEAYVYTPATTDFVPANVGAEGTTYDVSGITAYASGLKYNDRFYLEKASVSIANNADNSAAIVDKQVADVTLSGRKLFKDGGWNTLCLPFDLASLAGTPLEGATVKELDVTGTYDIDKQTGLKGTTLYLYFKDATAIKAGRPYIIRWDKAEGYEDDDAHNLVSPVFSGVTIDNTNRDVTFTGGAFKGTYAHISWDVETPSILFMGAGNKLNWPDVGASLGACRAYFLLADGASAREFKLNFGEETTGMSSLTPNPGLTPNPSPKGEGNFKGEGSDYWYSLDGRKVNGKPVRKGLYIYGGKKVAIK